MFFCTATDVFAGIIEPMKVKKKKRKNYYLTILNSNTLKYLNRVVYVVLCTNVYTNIYIYSVALYSRLRRGCHSVNNECTPMMLYAIKT